jgi:ribosomal protein L10
MPSREDLLAKLVFLLQSPVTRFVRSLAELPRQLVIVLEQVRQGKE